MHMADALLSPTVGGAFWAAAAGMISYSSRTIKLDLNDGMVPLMGVLGAFIFAVQMINFSIPATGSSGHLGGGMILAILLGPCAAFLSFTAVLTVQALFFADGGLLALGCNVVNLAIIPCFIAYPLIYKPITGENPSERRILLGALLAAVVGLQLGAFGVVLETTFSGVAELPFGKFLLLMQPVHLAIGIVEGLVTAAVVLFLRKARPELLQSAAGAGSLGSLAGRKVLIGFLLAAGISAGLLSWLSSPAPDGLEWSVQKVAGQKEMSQTAQQPYLWLAELQEKIALFPAYGFSERRTREVTSGGPSPLPVAAETSLAGLAGGAITLVLTLMIGYLLSRRGQATAKRSRH